MSRSGYSEDLDPLELGRWRGQVDSALRGKRGQAFLRDLIAALDALPDKKLVSGNLEKEGSVCALGALARLKAVNVGELDTYDYDALGETFNIAHQLAQETMHINDEYYPRDDAARWERVRDWAVAQLRATPALDGKAG